MSLVFIYSNVNPLYEENGLRVSNQHLLQTPKRRNEVAGKALGQADHG